VASALSQAVHLPVSDAQAHTTAQGDTLTAVIHSAAVPVRALSAGRIHLPGGRATAAQMHRETESVITIVSGYAALLWGPRMEPIRPQPGGMVYLPPGVPHALVNLSLNAGVLALVFRTDPAFTADLSPVPDLDAVVNSRLGELRADHLQRLMNGRSGHVRRPR
jgi:uncharacterized RmlC-like cupin family protein